MDWCKSKAVDKIEIFKMRDNKIHLTGLKKTINFNPNLLIKVVN